MPPRLFFYDAENGQRGTKLTFASEYADLEIGQYTFANEPGAGAVTTEEQKKILLVDLDDARRETRIALLEHEGHEVTLRPDYLSAEALDHEGGYDLIVLALHKDPQLAAEYTDRLSKSKPKLPILLLTDAGVFAPRGTFSPSLEAGSPKKLMARVAAMLAGSDHIREL